MFTPYILLVIQLNYVIILFEKITVKEAAMTDNNNSSAKKAFLFGSPVSHSISPAMHNLSFKILGINANYSAIDIDLDNIDSVTKYIRNDDFLGANVTMPLKNDIGKYIDRYDTSARLSYCLNTIVPENGELVGYTTDGAGFVDSLYNNDIDVKNRSILILGIGGAARSIIVKCAFEGAKSITIAVRNVNKLRVPSEFSTDIESETSCPIKIIQLDSDIMNATIDESDIIINATPVGMTDNNCLIDKKYLKPSHIVCDLIYNPSMTKLLINASERGCKYMNGKDMLLYQGARSFKLWTGKDMPIDEVKKMYFTD